MKNTSFRISKDEITLFRYCIPESINNENSQSLISSFSFTDQQYFNSIQNKDTQKRTLFGRIILRYVATLFEINEPEFLSFTSSGKPNFKSYSNLEFNISHSGNQVVCCITKDAPVGIDLEFIRPVDIEIYRNYFDMSEWQFITNSEHPDFEFLKLWVRKEAVIKADGRGFEINLSSFNCLKNKAIAGLNIYYMENIDLGLEYTCAVACSKNKTITLIDFNEIFNNEIESDLNINIINRAYEKV